MTIETELTLDDDPRDGLVLHYVPALTGPGQMPPTYPISTTGVWVNLATGNVVTLQPGHGQQLVAPGGQLTPEVLAAIEAAGGMP